MIVKPHGKYLNVAYSMEEPSRLKDPDTVHQMVLELEKVLKALGKKGPVAEGAKKILQDHDGHHVVVDTNWEAETSSQWTDWIGEQVVRTSKDEQAAASLINQVCTWKIKQGMYSPLVMNNPQRLAH
ncbi:hypothetical protein PtB15_10B358 [Puccinia triticina]|nr:hypothetical protein PtB15_10B358 [Puccinia triticina]